MFGNNIETIVDQALYKVSSQIDVLKHSVLDLNSAFVTSIIRLLFSWNLASRSES